MTFEFSRGSFQNAFFWLDFTEFKRFFFFKVFNELLLLLEFGFRLGFSAEFEGWPVRLQFVSVDVVGDAVVREFCRCAGLGFAEFAHAG